MKFLLFCLQTEQGTSSTSEDKAAEISLKTKLQKERLLAEEQRIQEQLKILKVRGKLQLCCHTIKLIYFFDKISQSVANFLYIYFH